MGTKEGHFAKKKKMSYMQNNDIYIYLSTNIYLALHGNEVLSGTTESVNLDLEIR